MRPVFLSVLLLLTGLACNLTQDSADSGAKITPIVRTATTTVSVTTTSAPASATPTARPTNTSAPSSGNNSGFVVNLPAPYPACSVVPTGNFTVNIRRQAGTGSAIVGILNPAAWVKVKALNNGWYQVDYPNTPVDNLWIAADPVTLTQPCACTPNCVAESAPPATVTSCRVTNNSSEVQPIFSEPGLITGEFVARFQPGATMDVVALDTGGWIKVRYDVPDATGWVLGANMAVNGNCEGIPNETVTPVRACRVRNNTSNINTIFDVPDGTYVGRFWPDTPAYAVAKRSTAWYRIYVPAFSNFYWIEAAFVSTEGACSTLPEE